MVRVVCAAAALLLLAAVPSSAVEQNCRLIRIKVQREACYTQQESELAAKRGKKTDMTSELQRMKRENDDMTNRLKSICRGC